MLKNVQVKIAAWGITGLMGAGSLFSGIAAQNVYAREGAAVESSNENTVDPGNTEITDQINENQGSYSDTSAGTLQSVPITEVNGGNTVSESPEQNSTAIENGTETESPEAPVKESTTGSESQNDDNAKEFSGTGATKDTKAVQAKKNGWVKVKGGYKYYKNGKAYTGWHKMGKAEGEKTEHYSYFGSDGIVRTGWQSMGKGTRNSYDENTAKHMCYFGKDGWLRTGWQSMGKKTKNSYDENTDKHMSYFGKNGWLRTGWQSMGKKTKNSYEENTDKHMSYFGKDGWLRTGWQSMGKKTKNSYDENTDKHMSYFGKDGWLRTGLQSMGKGTKNSYEENTNNHLSFFGNNGWLRVSQKVTVNGKKYMADGKGWLSDYENDVFMKYLKKIYNGATYYKYGLPHNVRGKGMWPNSEDIYQYIKYAIADFDNDGKNEMIIYLRYNYGRSNRNDMELERGYGYGIFDFYEVDSSGNISKNSYSGYLNNVGKFADSTVECFNNGVVTFIYKYGDMNGKTQYMPFNNAIRKKLQIVKDQGDDFWLFTFSYDYHDSWQYGKGYYCNTHSQEINEEHPLTKAQYDNDLKLLQSGKKINVTWKDFTSKNIK